MINNSDQFAARGETWGALRDVAVKQRPLTYQAQQQSTRAANAALCAAQSAARKPKPAKRQLTLREHQLDNRDAVLIALGLAGQVKPVTGDACDLDAHAFGKARDAAKNAALAAERQDSNRRFVIAANWRAMILTAMLAAEYGMLPIK